MTHRLKTWPEYFDAIRRNEKTFEIRREDDRHFDVGDKLLLDEFDPTASEYTNLQTLVTVTYVMRGPKFGLMPGWVIMGFKRGA